MTDSTHYFDVLKDAKRRHRDSLWAIPGVNGLGVGSPPGVDHGRRDADAIGITVSVDPDQVTIESDPRNHVPSSIEGCKVSAWLGKETIL